MRKYITIAELEAIDPAKAQRRRERIRTNKIRALERNPDLNRKYRRRHYEKNKDNILAKNAAWRAAHPGENAKYQMERKKNKRAVYIVQAVRRSAKRKGVNFDISVEWVQERLDRGICEVSGIEFGFLAQDRKKLPSIDRKDPDGDYVESNCRMVIFGINSSIGRLGESGVARVLTRLSEPRSEA